jgi:hypothetical protein
MSGNTVSDLFTVKFECRWSIYIGCLRVEGVNRHHYFFLWLPLSKSSSSSVVSGASVLQSNMIVYDSLYNKNFTTVVWAVSICDMRLKFLPSSEADGIPSTMERQQVSRFRRASHRFAVYGQKIALLLLFLLYYYLFYFEVCFLLLVGLQVKMNYCS